MFASINHLSSYQTNRWSLLRHFAMPCIALQSFWTRRTKSRPIQTSLNGGIVRDPVSVLRRDSRNKQKILGWNDRSVTLAKIPKNYQFTHRAQKFWDARCGYAKQPIDFPIQSTNKLALLVLLELKEHDPDINKPKGSGVNIGSPFTWTKALGVSDFFSLTLGQSC